MNKGQAVLFYPKTEKENMHKNIPLALLKIGSELKGEGYEVVVIDERFLERYENRLEDAIRNAIFFGVSVMTGYQIHGGLKAASFVKKLRPSLPVIWGGWHPSMLPEETLKNDNIDIIVKGQGERAVCELADAIKNNRDLRELAGISFKDGHGNILLNKPRALEDLNSFHPIRFDFIDVEKYVFKGPLGERSIFWNSSQGCPYNCTFCSTPAVFFRRWSGLKADKLLDQVRTLTGRYKVDAIIFAEDNFFVDMKRVKSFCEGLINEKLNIKWSTDLRVDQVNRISDEVMVLLRDSGCRKVYIGAESGDEEILNVVGKRITLEDTYKASEKLDKYKIISEYFIMVGFPYNPKKDIEKSLELIKGIKERHPDHQFTPFLYTPYPGTPLMDTSIQHGFRVPQRLEDWSDWSVLTVSTPWVDKRYLDRINMYVKCYYPLIFPSSSLRKKFKERFRGLPYRVLHRVARFRVKKNFFRFPIEWILIKLFYQLQVRFNIFKGFESFR